MAINGWSVNTFQNHKSEIKGILLVIQRLSAKIKRVKTTHQLERKNVEIKVIKKKKKHTYFVFVYHFLVAVVIFRFSQTDKEWNIVHTQIHTIFIKYNDHIGHVENAAYKLQWQLIWSLNMSLQLKLAFCDGGTNYLHTYIPSNSSNHPKRHTKYS